MISNLQNAHKNNVEKFCILAKWWMNLYEFARDAVTRYHRLDDLNNRNLLSHSSRGLKSKIKVSTSEVSLLGL